MWVLPVWRGWEDQTVVKRMWSVSVCFCGQWTVDFIRIQFVFTTSGNLYLFIEIDKYLVIWGFTTSGNLYLLYLVGLQVQNPQRCHVQLATNWCKREVLVVPQLVTTPSETSWVSLRTLGFSWFLWKPKPRAMGIKLANRMLKQWPTRSNKYLVICWWYRHVSRLSHRFAMFCSWLHNLKIWSTLFPVWAIIIVVVGKTGTFFLLWFSSRWSSKLFVEQLMSLDTNLAFKWETHRTIASYFLSS